MAESTFTFRLDEDLKRAFADVATAQDRTAAQLLRVLMRESVRRHADEQAHDQWFRAEVERSVAEAAERSVPRASHDEVRTSWQRQRAEIETQGKSRSA